MPDLNAIKVPMVLDASEFQKGLEKTRERIATFAAGITAAAATIGGLTVSGLRYAQEQRAMAARINDTVEATSALNRVGATYGLEVDDITGAMDMFAEQLGEANKGSKSQLEAFKELGFTVKDLKDLALLPAVARLGAFSDKLRMVKSDTDRARIGNTLLGGDYLKLIPLLAAGSKELNRQAREYERLGLVMSGKFAEGADKALRSINKLATVFGALDVIIAQQFGAQLGRTAEFLLDALPAALAAVNAVINGIGATVAATVSIIGDLTSGNFEGLWRTLTTGGGLISQAYNEPVDRAVANLSRPSAFAGTAGPFGGSTEDTRPITEKQGTEVVFLLQQVDGTLKDLRSELGSVRP